MVEKLSYTWDYGLEKNIYSARTKYILLSSVVTRRVVNASISGRWADSSVGGSSSIFLRRWTPVCTPLTTTLSQVHQRLLSLSSSSTQAFNQSTEVFRGHFSKQSRGRLTYSLKQSISSSAKKIFFNRLRIQRTPTWSVLKSWWLFEHHHSKPRKFSWGLWLFHDCSQIRRSFLEVSNSDWFVRTAWNRQNCLKSLLAVSLRSPKDVRVIARDKVYPLSSARAWSMLPLETLGLRFEPETMLLTQHVPLSPVSPSLSISPFDLSKFNDSDLGLFLSQR